MLLHCGVWLKLRFSINVTLTTVKLGEYGVAQSWTQLKRLSSSSKNDLIAWSLPPAPPWVYWNSCPLSRWCHPTITPSITPFSSCPALTFCAVIQAFNRWLMPHALVRVIFTQSDSNANNLFWKQHHRYSLKQCVPAIWASLSPAKLTHKIKYQRRGRECGHFPTLFSPSQHHFPSRLPAVTSWVGSGGSKGGIKKKNSPLTEADVTWCLVPSEYGRFPKSILFP